MEFQKYIENMTIEEIPWNVIIEECYETQLKFFYDVEKVIYTNDRTERAVILKKPNGLYTIALQKLYPLTDDDLRYSVFDLPGIWHTYDNSNSVFDTEKRAINSVMTEPPFKYNECPE